MVSQVNAVGCSQQKGQCAHRQQRGTILRKELGLIPKVGRGAVWRAPHTDTRGCAGGAQGSPKLVRSYPAWPSEETARPQLESHFTDEKAEASSGFLLPSVASFRPY